MLWKKSLLKSDSDCRKNAIFVFPRFWRHINRFWSHKSAQNVGFGRLNDLRFDFVQKYLVFVENSPQNRSDIFFVHLVYNFLGRLTEGPALRLTWPTGPMVMNLGSRTEPMSLYTALAPGVKTQMGRTQYATLLGIVTAIHALYSWPKIMNTDLVMRFCGSYTSST
jgi:hypothetical protein